MAFVLKQLGGGSADMEKSVYDQNDDGVVDSSAEVEGVDSAGNLKYYGTDGLGDPGFHDLPAGGTGDMTKAVYDTGDNGIVDSAEAVDGVAGAGNDQYYGTNGAGTPGFYSLPTASLVTVNAETLAATKTLTSTSEAYQFLDSGGSARDVVLEDPPTTGRFFLIQATAADGLNIKETAAGATQVTLQTGIGNLFRAECIYDGTNWQITTFAEA